MPKVKISEYSQTASSNTDINSININEGCPPSTINNAIRELMSQIKDFQVGSEGDGLTVGGSLVVVGTSTFGAVQASSFGAITATSANISGALSVASASISGALTTATANITTATIGAVLGTSATLTNPLPVASGGTALTTLTAENVILGNGTSAVKFVAPGTTGNVLTSNGTTWASTAIPAQGIGVGQTWQNVTGSRSLGTTYTNSTGKPIMVVVRTTNNSLSAEIGGVNLGVVAANQSGGSGGQTVSMIVPAGDTYIFTSSGSLSNWSELR